MRDEWLTEWFVAQMPPFFFENRSTSVPSSHLTAEQRHETQALTAWGDPGQQHPISPFFSLKIFSLFFFLFLLWA